MSLLQTEIETLLKTSHFPSKDAMRTHLKLINFKITQLEQANYGKDNSIFTEIIPQYKMRMLEILKSNKFNTEKQEEETPVEEEGINVLKLINTQLSKADENQELLEKGTLKLESLDYTNTDIFSEIQKANKKIKELKDKERYQVTRIKRAYMVLIFVCMLILADKTHCRLIRPSIYIYKKIKGPANRTPEKKIATKIEPEDESVEKEFL